MNAITSTPSPSLCVFKKKHRIAAAGCPNCGLVFESSIGISTTGFTANPQRGALMTCSLCGMLLEFDGKLFDFAPAARLEEIPEEIQQKIEAEIDRPIVTRKARAK